MSSEENIVVTNEDQRHTLLMVLLLNVLLSASLAVTGVIGDSSGLIANALDNASDAAVYTVSYFAIGRSPEWKRAAALVSGVLLLVFAAGVLADAARRFMSGAEPIGPMMMVMSVLSAGINLWCLRLLQRLHSGDVNMQAAETFSYNDFVSNIGILVAGVLVAWTGRFWPDLVVGVAIAVVATKGGIEILHDARKPASGEASGNDEGTP